MSEKTQIKTTKIIYPQIYAYTLPRRQEDVGWLKIGYTEREDVETRIKEQTKTAALQEPYDVLWHHAARFKSSDKWFKDKPLHAYLRKFKGVDQRPHTEWFYYNGTPWRAEEDFEDFRSNVNDQAKQELEYQLRAEQQAAVSQTLEYAQGHPGSEFLWNAKPRFGKTLTTYDLARQMHAENVLVVTNRPAIANSWFDDFEKFIAWQTNYKFVSTSDSLKDRPVLTREQYVESLTDNTRQIAFISLQDLKGAIAFGGGYDKLAWVKQINWDLLVVDESHEGVDTFKTDVAFNEIKRNFTLHLSGTPFKAVAEGKFEEEQIFNWTYTDEQEAKMNWPVESEENNPYASLPRLSMFSYQMSQMITDEVNQGANIEGESKEYAFDLNEFFETDDQGKFIHESDVKKWLDSLTHNEKYPFSTQALRNELKHTFWILNRVASAKALQKLLEKHPVFENYKVVLAAGDGRVNDDDQTINEKSLDRVREAIKANDKTITLSVGQLTTGVTVPEWTAVMMLSNMKSQSLYMQAAFRAQNPWEYEVDGEWHQKENAYVFDFAPERTLQVYDGFANNLSNKTAKGGGTSDERKENIRKLLNFFPVIAEDNEGKMVELDVNQVLTIPKTVKAQEVVRHGFMSNLLFQNVSGIFASAGAREILENLNPVAPGKSVPTKTDKPIDTKNVRVDDEGNATVPEEVVVSTTAAKFGEKIYEEVPAAAPGDVTPATDNLAKTFADAFKERVQGGATELAKEQGVTKKAAEAVISQGANAIAREVQVEQEKAKIKQNEATVIYKREVQEAQSNPVKLEEAKVAYEAKQQEIEQNFRKEVETAVAEKTKEVAKDTADTILKKSEEKKKTTVEDDIRARLRGFARTIPSFLMAYGTPETTLASFDTTIKDAVFKEVTGITLEQFRTLRDTYNFFDEVVFDQSIQEFLNKRVELADYFNDDNEEDIFDYIPPQQTNQIFTPKRVVKMMVDDLEKEEPGIFTDPNRTFADLYMKSGLYITEIVKRLFDGLKDQIPDENKRLKHILENQVYGFAPTEIIYNISRNFIFGFDENVNDIDDSHIVHLDTVPFVQGDGDLSVKLDELFGGNE